MADTYFMLAAKCADRTSADLRQRLDKTTARQQIRAYSDYLRGINGGSLRAVVTTTLAATTASQTIGCDQSDAVDATDSVTIGPTTLSVEASPADEDEFLQGATDIAFAANLAAAINAHSVLSKIVTAASDGVDTVTVTCRWPGIIGNEIALAEAGLGFTLGAAALAGGTQDETDEFGKGMAAAV